MTFNSKGKLAKFYQFFAEDGKPLPEDFCTYFWGLVGRLAFVIAVPGSVVTLLIYGLIKLVLWTIVHWRGAAAGLVMIATMAVLVWLATRKKQTKIELFSETKAIIKGKVDAVKNRCCPRIEWR